MLRSIKKFLRLQEGVAFVEFAITLPFLLALFMGAVEVTRYILIAQKVEKATVTISDVVAQEKTIGTTAMNQLITAVSQVMQPYTFSTNGYVIVSSVTPNAGGTPTIQWQYKGGGTWAQSSKIGSSGGTATLPTGFTLSAGENVIIAEVYYNYTTLMVNSVIPGGTIYKTAFFKPRLGTLNTLGS